MKIDTVLNESGLARLWNHNERYDCAAMTAFRKARDCNTGQLYTMAEKKARNKSLLAKLQTKGYGVTKLIGIYPEAGVKTKERSFFIVDLQERGTLLNDVKKWGEEFEQDSVLFVPKGAIKNETKAFLIGTNRCENNWLGYGRTSPFDLAKMGKESPIYTSYVKGRPFIFEEVSFENLLPGNGMGYWAMAKAAEKPWEDLIEE